MIWVVVGLAALYWYTNQ